MAGVKPPLRSFDVDYLRRVKAGIRKAGATYQEAAQ